MFSLSFWVYFKLLLTEKRMRGTNLHVRRCESWLCCGVAGHIARPVASSSTRCAHEHPPHRAAMMTRRGKVYEDLAQWQARSRAANIATTPPSWLILLWLPLWWGSTCFLSPETAGRLCRDLLCTPKWNPAASSSDCFLLAPSSVLSPPSS